MPRHSVLELSTVHQEVPLTIALRRITVSKNMNISSFNQLLKPIDNPISPGGELIITPVKGGLY